MERPDPPLERAVDDVLEPAWPRERRRALAQMAASSVWRISVFMGALVLFALVARLVVGRMVPWTFFALMGGLALVGGLPSRRERAHLARTETGDTEIDARLRSRQGYGPRTGAAEDDRSGR